MSTHLRHADELAVVVGDQRIVVLELDQPEKPPVVFTDSAAAIWEAVDGTRDTDGVVAHVAHQFGVEASEIRDHVHGFLQELLALNLLVTA